MALEPPVTPSRAGGDRCPGAVRLHEAADGLLARIRVPGGILTADQVVALADAARTLGDGAVGLTARGNVEIRALRAQDTDRFARLLDAAGLLPSPSHERVRNVVASPLAGIDGGGLAGPLIDAVRRLDRLLCSHPRTAALSGRFLFALDDGRGDMPGLDPDLLARWVAPDAAEISVGTHPVAHVPAAQAPEALIAAAIGFLDAREQAGDTAWRVADLADPAAAAAHIGIHLRTQIPDAQPAPEHPQHIHQPLPQTPLPGPGPVGSSAVHLMLRLGRACADTWMALASAARHVDGLVRTTPARGVILAGLNSQQRDDLLLAADTHGLITDSRDPAHEVTACTGLPGCASSRADVRTHVEQALADHDLAAAAGDVPRLPVHVSGCERRCGHPRHRHAEAVAADEFAYATAVVDGSPAVGAPLGDGTAALSALISPHATTTTTTTTTRTNR